VKWVGNITYIRTWEGFVYLATVLDCCTKKVVGYAMADQMRTSLPCETIDMATDKRPPREDEAIFHSDRGRQCTSETFAQYLKAHGIISRLIHKLPHVSAGCVRFVGRRWAVLESRGRDMRLIEPGAG